MIGLPNKVISDLEMRKRSLSILMISSGFYPEVDGTAFAIGNIMQNLKRNGHKITLVTRRYRNCPRFELWFGIPVFRVGPGGASIYSRIMLAINQIGVSIALIIREKVDIIHAHGFAPLLSGLISGLFLRKPVVVTFHGFQSLWLKGTRWRKESTDKILQPFFRAMTRMASAVTAQSKKFKEVIAHMYGVKRQRVHIISHQIDEEFFEYTPELTVKEPVVLFVGTLRRVYGVDLFIKSVPHTLERFPNVKFVIVGKGPLMERLKELAKELGVEEHVAFVGPVFNRKKLAGFYRSAKVVVIPQKYEGYFLSLVALEAMAAGKPIVTTQTLDPELYRIGFFKASFEPKDLAEKIAHVLSMKDEEYVTLSRNIRRYFEVNHSRKAVITKIEKLYLHLIEKS